MTLMAGQQKRHPACKNTEWWSVGMVLLSAARCGLAYGSADAIATHYHYYHYYHYHLLQ